MKLKYGDKIRRIGGDCNTLVREGQVYTFRDYDSDGIHLHIMEDRTSYGYSIGAFELVKNAEPPKNDIEWLDRIQENFKD
jgi:hypothetical protein